MTTVLIRSREFIEVLYRQGLVPANSQRVVIDATHEHVLLHYTVFAGESLLEVIVHPKLNETSVAAV